jgi:hypothetical protein
MRLHCMVRHEVCCLDLPDVWHKSKSANVKRRSCILHLDGYQRNASRNSSESNSLGWVMYLCSRQGHFPRLPFFPTFRLLLCLPPPLASFFCLSLMSRSADETRFPAAFAVELLCCSICTCHKLRGVCAEEPWRTMEGTLAMQARTSSLLLGPFPDVLL